MALPSTGPLGIAQIASELQGERNLGYYRGRTYWRGQSQVTISNAPSISEFYGLQLAAPYNYWPVGGWVEFQVDGDLQVATPTIQAICGTGRRRIRSWGQEELTALIATFSIPCPGLAHKNFNGGVAAQGGGFDMGVQHALPSGAVMRAAYRQSGLSGEALVDITMAAGTTQSALIGMQSGFVNYCDSSAFDSAMSVWQFGVAPGTYYGGGRLRQTWVAPDDYALDVAYDFACHSSTPQFVSGTVRVTRIA